MMASMESGSRLLAGLVIGAALSTVARAAEPPLAHGEFALVGKTVISNSEYAAAFSAAKRAKYYHATPPAAEVAALQREVADNLIDEVLVLAEAQRRGIRPDATQVAAAIRSYEQRYAKSAQWQQNRERLLPGLTRQLERQSVMEQMTHKIRTVEAPTPAQISAYYDTHKALFTQPEQVRVGLILLKVDPSSARTVWDQAHREAAAIRGRIVKGADFAEAARLHSAHDSAPRGGDMGFVHRGVLPEGMERLLDSIRPGVVSDPVELLEGVALMRLIERKPARLHPLQDVRTRATQLWQREQADRQWRAFIAELRSKTVIQVNNSLQALADHDAALPRAAAKR